MIKGLWHDKRLIKGTVALVVDIVFKFLTVHFKVLGLAFMMLI